MEDKKRDINGIECGDDCSYIIDPNPMGSRPVLFCELFNKEIRLNENRKSRLSTWLRCKECLAK